MERIIKILNQSRIEDNLYKGGLLLLMSIIMLLVSLLR